MSSRPTIFALSSGRPPAAIAVIRISGSRAGDALVALGIKIPEPRKAALARIRDADNEIIDEALALWFPGPNSETGEDTAELQLHGGRAVIAGVLDALGRVEGLRPAEAGEFTRRAFENGKLDLTAVEGLADLVGAETQGQRRQAFRQMKGLLGNRAETWRQRLIQALALVEARIDFSDEGDVPDNLTAPALAIARELAGEIEAALADGGRGERLREGMVVAIAGPPNAGKSTLLNRLARREAAIVSPHAGTTRDVIEVHLELSGLPVTLLDTAGIRETDDPVEMEGVRRARERAAGADLVLWVEDASAAGRSVDDVALVVSGGVGEKAAAAHAADAEGADLGGSSPVGAALHATLAGGAAHGPPVWLVVNKADLVYWVTRTAAVSRKNEPNVRTNKPLRGMGNEVLTTNNEYGEQIYASLKNLVNNDLPPTVPDTADKNDAKFTISALSGDGFEGLLSSLTAYAERFLVGAESALVTRARHRRALEETAAALRRSFDGAAGDELVAEELRLAAQALGRLTGRVDVEDVLDVIFRDFCIGK